MIIDISVAAIALAFVVLVVFLILTLQTSRKTLEKTNRLLAEVQKDLGALSEVSIELIQNSNDLTLDIKKKSETLDALFRPFQASKREKLEESGPKTSYEQIAEIMECLAGGVLLFNKIKEGVKEYVKSR